MSKEVYQLMQHHCEEWLESNIINTNVYSDNQAPLGPEDSKQLIAESLLKENKRDSSQDKAERNIPIVTKIINLEELKKSSNFGKKQYPDSEYEGDLVNGKRHGKGLMMYKNGRIYEGSWANDYREGKGIEKYRNGSIYEGDFLKGKAHGKGIYTWGNGEVYDGEWKDGLKHGDGIWKGSDGDSYIGEWRLSKAEGYGVHIWKTGIRKML